MSLINKDLLDAAETVLDREAILAAHPPEKTVARPGGGLWTRRKGQVAPKVSTQRHGEQVLVTHTHVRALATALAHFRFPGHDWQVVEQVWLRRHIGELDTYGAPRLEVVDPTTRATGSFPGVLLADPALAAAVAVGP